MLGDGLVRQLVLRHSVHCTIRSAVAGTTPRAIVHTGVDVINEDVLAQVMRAAQPDLVVNAVGIVKQYADSVSTEEFIAINALFPHRLARLTGTYGTKLIHISTDCVFSGRKGQYTEDYPPDPIDVYGMSKALGEPAGHHVTVLRCSMIGLEEARPGKLCHGLIAWFLHQSGTIPGFRRARFSGLTIRAFSRLIDDLASRGGLPGLWHVAAEPISKFDLLTRLASRLPERRLVVAAVDSPAIDRTLDPSAFRKASGCEAPSWDEMLDELAADIRQSEGRAA